MCHALMQISRVQPFSMVKGKRFLNLVAVAESQLIEAGVVKIYPSGLCSYSDARFFSARRVQRSAIREFDGRLATVALLKG